MSSRSIEPASRLQGEVVLSGDPSQAATCLALAAISAQPVLLENVPDTSLVRDAIAMVEGFGAHVEHESDARRASVRGAADYAPSGPVSVGGHAHVAWLAVALGAAQAAPVELTGAGLAELRALKQDLAAGGVRLAFSGDRVQVSGQTTDDAQPITVVSPVARDVLLLAAAASSRGLAITDPTPHYAPIERLLQAAGVPLRRSAETIRIAPGGKLQLPHTELPADPFVAALIATAAAVLPQSLVRIPAVATNDSAGVMADLLERMGARVATLSRRKLGSEPVVDLEIEGGALQRVRFEREQLARTGKAAAAVAIACQFSRGESPLWGFDDSPILSESWLAELALRFGKLGMHVERHPGGIIVRGSGRRPDGGVADTISDPHIAAAAVVTAVLGRQASTIGDVSVIDEIFPGLIELFDRLRD